VIEKLSEYEYLDDARFASDLALSRLRQKPQGKRRLKQTLSRKKLDKDTVEQAILHAFEAMPEAELIDRAIEKRITIKGRPRTRDETRKFYDHLLRQGFGYDLIISKMRGIADMPIDPVEIE
jgi:SOS response regulatory protein OraA/RecX